MRSKVGPPLLIGVLIVFAGCAGLPGSNSTTSPATTAPNPTDTTPATTSPSLPVEDAQQRALNAEKNRIEQVLENASNISGASVGIYGKTNATVVNQSSTGVQVQVTVSYSYEYNCGNESGAVDGLTTTSLYTVTTDDVKLVDVTEDVRLACNGSGDAERTDKQRAIAAEKTRVSNELANMTNVTGSAGIYGTVNATILNQTGPGTYVRVQMPFSYEYHCNGEDGNVDGMMTNVVYHVTSNETTITEIENDVKNACST